MATYFTICQWDVCPKLQINMTSEFKHFNWNDLFGRFSAGDQLIDDLESFELDHFRSLGLERMRSLKIKGQIK